VKHGETFSSLSYVQKPSAKSTLSPALIANIQSQSVELLFQLLASLLSCFSHCIPISSVLHRHISSLMQQLLFDTSRGRSRLFGLS
jgi:hypothetical protein